MININDYKTGDKFTAEIMGEKVEGKVYIVEDFGIFLCQNSFSGMHSPDLLGYNGSWVITEDEFKYGRIPNVTDLKVFNTLNRKERIQNLSL